MKGELGQKTKPFKDTLASSI